MREGLKAALATDARYIMTMDADQSHDVGDVSRLLEAICSGEVDMVQGSRYVRGGEVQGWASRRHLLSRVANLLYHWCAGAPHESTTNFRVFSRRAAAVVEARAKGSNYEFVPEATLLVLAAGLRVRGRSKLGTKQAVKGLISFLSVSVQYRLRMGRFGRGPAKANGPLG